MPSASEQAALDALYGLPPGDSEAPGGSSSVESGIIRIVDAHESVVVRERQTHIAHCEDELLRIEARQAVLVELHAKTKEKLEAARAAERKRTGAKSEAAVAEERQAERRRAEERVKRNVPRPNPVSPSKIVSLEAEIRDAIVELGVYTIRELSSKLGQDRRAVRTAHAAFLEREQTKAVGSFAGEPRFEYQAPERAGEAFEAQYELATVTELPMRMRKGRSSDPVPFTGKPRGPSGRTGQTKRAMAAGHQIKRKGKR